MSIEIEHLTKKRSGHNAYALKDVTLSLPDSDFYVFTGESGCGKATLLRLLAGFERPESGIIRMDGETLVSEYTFVAPEQRDVGMVFSDYALFPHMNVEQNVGFGLSRLNREARRKRVAHYLDLTGLSGSGRKRLKALGNEERLMVSLARALAPRPAVILLDKPFDKIERSYRAELRRKLRDIIRHTGTMAVMVTLDTDEALAIASQIAVLKRGKLQQFDSPKQIYYHPKSEYICMMFGKANIVTVDESNAEWLRRLSINERLGNRICIRPENLYIVPTNNSEARGVVTDVTFYGRYNEIHVKPLYNDRQGEDELIISATHLYGLDRGQMVGLQLVEEGTYSLLKTTPGKPVSEALTARDGTSL